MNPTKENGSGGQQGYDPSTGKFAPKEGNQQRGSGAQSGGQTAPSSGWKAYLDAKAEMRKNPDSASKRLGYDPVNLDKYGFDSMAKAFPDLTESQIADLPSVADLVQSGMPGLSESPTVEDLRKAVGRYAQSRSKMREGFQKAFDSYERSERSAVESLKKMGFTDDTAKKARSFQKAYQKAVGDASKELESLGKDASGYSEGRSVRALKAMSEGRFPASDASAILGVSPARIKKLFKTNYEWHHTGGGGMFNQTDFYDLSSLDWFGREDDGDEKAYKEGAEALKELWGKKNGNPSD